MLLDNKSIIQRKDKNHFRHSDLGSVAVVVPNTVDASTLHMSQEYVGNSKLNKDGKLVKGYRIFKALVYKDVLKFTVGVNKKYSSNGQNGPLQIRQNKKTSKNLGIDTTNSLEVYFFMNI